MGIITDIKTIASAALSAGDYKLHKEILELQEKIEELVNENKTLKAKLEEYEKLKGLGEDLEPRDGAYWKKDGTGPFCMRCWGKEKELRHMKGSDVYECAVCEYTHATERYAQELDDEIFRANREL